MLPPITNADPGDETDVLDSDDREHATDAERDAGTFYMVHLDGCGAFGRCDCPVGLAV